MKICSNLLLSACLLLSTLTAVAADAQARIYCLSLRFQRGYDQYDFYNLDLTLLSFGVNGELGPYGVQGYSHYSYIDLIDTFSFETAPGAITLNLPVADTDGDGFNDFFQADKAVNATTSGLWQIPGMGSGTITANWSRAAGAKDGDCWLNLGGLDSFHHYFEILEFTGPLSYTTSATNVSGMIAVMQTAYPDAWMRGPIQFTKNPTNRFNMLSLQSGTWTNSYTQELPFLTNSFSRPTAHPTNYFGYFDFQDWDPGTPDPDYTIWVLSITDTNDANHNGIPDFSDDSTSPLPRRPQLSLKPGAGNLQLTISGDVGRTHLVQELPSLGSTLWQTVATVALTNDPQVVQLPLPTTSPKFWRVIIPLP